MARKGPHATPVQPPPTSATKQTPQSTVLTTELLTPHQTEVCGRRYASKTHPIRCMLTELKTPSRQGSSVVLTPLVQQIWLIPYQLNNVEEPQPNEDSLSCSPPQLPTQPPSVSPHSAKAPTYTTAPI
ncbi:hypothetical protein AMECASPLE_012925 [Ameca splendens]|uniref:Uncharacterized protein n=1 Tax=Ameca splendens TaxID=208324 RepID=A0ABV0YC89_9TELE